ncbi:hypothetical protein F5Y11DRAFT_367780 [Daldinia sp. FL1419]|nr:hypothetical protein F5Y11DRAFT_367780 [Daldinia sp. FL1419]
MEEDKPEEEEDESMIDDRAEEDVPKEDENEDMEDAPAAETQSVHAYPTPSAVPALNPDIPSTNTNLSASSPLEGSSHNLHEGGAADAMVTEMEESVSKVVLAEPGSTTDHDMEGPADPQSPNSHAGKYTSAPALSNIPKSFLLQSKPREAPKLDLSVLQKTLQSAAEERSRANDMGRGGKQKAIDQAIVKGALLPDTYYTVDDDGLAHKDAGGDPFTEWDDERLRTMMERLDAASNQCREEQDEKNLQIAEAEKKLKEERQKKKNDADFQALMKRRKQPANPFLPKKPKKPADKK